MSDLYSNLNYMYDLSKTLRFELIPIGKTLENIKNSAILEKDEHRAKIYKQVKKYCDNYHKSFIDKCLQNFVIDINLLKEYNELFLKEKKTEKDKKRILEIQGILRKEISNRFKNNDEYNGLFGKDMINSYLVTMYEMDKEKLEKVSEFKKFTTYFQNFNISRKNMYEEKEKSTAISYRLINENLPIFVNNIKIFNKALNVIPNFVLDIFQNVNEYMQVCDVKDMFSLEYFSNTLTQSNIEIYNLIISGRTDESGKKIKGINEVINEYNQLHKDTKLPKLRQLYKQILTDKVGTSFKIEVIETDQQLVDCINSYYEILQNCIYDNDKRVGISNLLSNINEFDINKIYLNNDKNITNLSQEMFKDWHKIKKLISEKYDGNYIGKKKINTKAYENEKEENLKKIQGYSLNYLDELVENEKILVSVYLAEYMANAKLIENIEKFYENCSCILEKEYEFDSKDLIKDEESIHKIKELLDSIKKLQEFLKKFIVKDNNIEKDEIFYNTFIELYNKIKEIDPLYNKVRNYLTQKPYSNEKIKINFETPTLLSGWDKNKEKDNLGGIFLKDNLYYLGILNPHKRNILKEATFDTETNCYKKMEYKLLPGPNKMLPKVFFSKSRIGEFKPSKDLLEKYEKGLHKKGDNFDLNFCHNLIDFYKQSLAKHEEWKEFKFKFKETFKYKDIGEFYNDVEKQGYKISFANYSEEYINSLVEAGDLYLFKIYNKDFSEYSKGKPNLHTLYWKEIFSEENLARNIYKLNGDAEIFYRKASLKLEETTIHEKNKPMKNKNSKNPKKETVLEYDVIKDKRYTKDKFQLNVSITLNFDNKSINNLNEIVNKYLYKNDVNVIGIDRGERNLLYITVVNPKGEILEQFSLNEIINKYKEIEYRVNYHELLHAKEIARDEARKSWETIENIKELKEGYLSQVVHKIVELMEKYKAIIVIEDLNNGFKNSRIKVEKQVYQKFEKMLIDKLNYLIFKEKDKFENGGILNAYQLTNKFESFQKIGKQTGVLFYIPAWCTSKIDPTTGFVNLLYCKYESVEKSKSFINKFDDITYDFKNNYYVFSINYSKFTNRAYGVRESWYICTFGNRIETFRNFEKNNEWDNKDVNLTEEFSDLFKKYNIDIDNLKFDILKQEDKEFYVEFMRLIKLTLQMRNSIPNSLTDYMISPVKNKYGKFYSSNNCDETLPQNADANGAYNIARKGLMLINQIRNSKETDLNKVKYKISNEEWLEYVQKEGM